MIRIPKGVILPEALLIVDAVTVVERDGVARVTVGEVKVFADRGGHTDPQQLATARAQAGVYQHAFELAVDGLGLDGAVEVAPDGFLVFTWPGSNSPAVRPAEELTYQAIRAERGFQRLEEVAQSLVRDDDFRRTTRRLSSAFSTPAPTTPRHASLSATSPRGAISAPSRLTTRSSSAAT